MKLLREYIRGLLIETAEDDEDREVGEAEKLITLFLEDSNQISTAQMIPGQEKLVRDMERILIQVRMLIDIGETLAAQRDQPAAKDTRPAGDEAKVPELRRLRDRIINRVDSMIINHLPNRAASQSFHNTKRVSHWFRTIDNVAQCWRFYSADQMTHVYSSGKRHVPEMCEIEIDNIKAWAGVK